MKTNKQGIPAAAFMATFSSPRHDITPASPKPSNHPQFTVVERWNGQKWIEVRLEWNGTEYREAR